MKPRDLLHLLFFIRCAFILLAQQLPSYAHHFECRVDDPLSCDQAKNEVCVFRNGGYSCGCPQGIDRSADGRCIVINECAEPRLNDCHTNAKCIDKIEGYTCQCLSGYADVSENPETKPGRICQLEVNECADPSNYPVDCSENAICKDTPESFTCICNPGFTDISAHISLLPGRKCVEVVDECHLGTNDCSVNAQCIDQPVGYICKCKEGFVDASPNVTHYPGRQCISPKGPQYVNAPQPQQSQSHCHPVFQPTCSMNQVCASNAQGMHSCQCSGIATRTGGCITFNRCERHHDCDPAAICSNTYDSYKCQCPPGFLDVSPDPVRLPGRKCTQLINECGTHKHDCSPYATCIDTLESFLCHCNAGYTDVSSRYGLKPGRRCAQSRNQCANKLANSCDENADCVTLPDGYACICAPGYVDVSSNANLPPGRVCTLHTQCPSQPTDLVFLIDGSGSIGSEVFRQEVLRFVKDFIELFDISPQQTRVAVVQYSDRIRHEFDLNQYPSAQQLKQAIDSIEYLTGLTRTGAAIEHVANEAFSERRGARPLESGIPKRVTIVITDGRSQDNVTVPVESARRKQIQLYAVGVTNHALDSELESIAGSKQRTFHVNAFEDLNARLRSAIQKVACPGNTPTTGIPPSIPKGPCDPKTHSGCDRSLNQICAMKSGKYCCTCPREFEQHPVTRVCGGDLCNPQIVSSCPSPEVCQLTPFGNYRCACPPQSVRDPKSGVCTTHYVAPPSMPGVSPFTDECSSTKPCKENEQCVISLSGKRVCQCIPGYEISPSGKCQTAGTCEPYMPEACDQRKHEECLPDGYGRFSCQCAANHRRHPVTQICLIDECAAGTHDCDRNAKCTDTDDGYICTCPKGYIDESPNPSQKPGRVCREQADECALGTHNCSVNAYCIDLPKGFLCRCKENYIDFSPNPQHFGGTNCKPLVDECADRSLNTCSENAICIDTKESYKCQCKEGYTDHDELRNPGRICEKANRLCTYGQNNCDTNAKCIEKGTNGYTCVCDVGFLDKSPDPNKPGRVCVERICIDSSKHDCHAAAICTEVSGPERYTCACRNGYIDVNPSKPGRVCKESVNECLDPSLNDCDPTATCYNLQEGYTCTCPPNSKDVSPDRQKPGRKCYILVNECSNPHLNNCSRFADCIDREDGYECRCKPDYHDNNPAKPGTDCIFILNECDSPNLNNCDKHAKCIETKESFRCECIHPYIDQNPSQPGTVCRYNECNDTNANDCDKNAICTDTDDGYTCHCKAGYYDTGEDPKKPGRTCIAIITGQPPQAEPTTISPNLLPCGTAYCHLDLGEVCIGGEHCSCRPGQARSSPTEKCINVEKVPIEVRVVSDGSNKLAYSTDYSRPQSQHYVEIVDKFIKDMGAAIKNTPFAPQYVTSDVNYITNPKVKNSTWDNGLLINGSVAFTSPVDQCQFWKQFIEVLQRESYRLGNGQLLVASDVALLDPCRKEEQRGFACGAMFCQEELGEVCIAGRLCGCPSGQKRSGLGEKCRPVESWTLPLWVIRDGSKQLNYTDNLANPHDEQYKQLVTAFEKGIGESYANTPLRNGFVVAEVNDIRRPSDFIKNWDHGILYNFTVNFVRGSVASPPSVFTDLLNYITQRNNFEVGQSKQYISPIQANPFDICYKSDCHPDAICTSSSTGYTCKCPETHRDLNPSSPGRVCVSTVGVNECERREWNECDEHARCIDENHLYRCECIKPYVNAAPPGSLPGSVCRLDYCSDVNFCPANTTCQNQEEQAVCVCKSGYVDIRSSPYRTDLGYSQDVYCLLPLDVRYCALGLTNCSAVAICTDVRNGYECRCPEGYVDGNPAEPGRVCAAQLCGLCNGHGDCVYNEATKNVTCACVEGYTGEFCEIAPSNALLILFLILASILLLLSLCCCLYLCSRLRCFRGRDLTPSAGSAQEILGSDYYSIPRAKLRRRDMEQPTEMDAGQLQRYIDEGGSISGESTGSSVEIERRVITDITTHEIKTTTYHDPVTGRAIYEVTATASSGADEGAREQFVQAPIEAEAEHYAAAASAGRYARSGSAVEQHYSRAESPPRIRESGTREFTATRTTRQIPGEYDEREVRGEGEEEIGEGVFDRTTKLSTQHDFIPAEYGRGGTERRRDEFSTTTRSQETSYH